MQFGIVFPQTEIGADPAAVRDYTQAAEALGYAHLIFTTMCWAPMESTTPT